jgi:hypothetical protein
LSDANRTWSVGESRIGALMRGTLLQALLTASAYLWAGGLDAFGQESRKSDRSVVPALGQVHAVGLAPSETLARGAAGHWWEAWVTIQGGSEPLTGFLAAGAPRTDRVELVTLRSLEMPAEALRRARLPLLLTAEAAVEGSRIPLSVGFFERTGRNEATVLNRWEPKVFDFLEVETGKPLEVVVVGDVVGAYGNLGKVLANDPRLSAYRLIVPLVSSSPVDASSVTAFEWGPRMRGRPPALPNHPLCWSGISHVIWDGISPDVLTAEQYEGLLSWLHWGGTLVFSGGMALQAVESSEFAAWLPVVAGETSSWNLAVEPVVVMGWRLQGQVEPSVLSRELDGRRLEPRRVPFVRTLMEDAAGNALVVERWVGRGRVVAVAFDLDDPALSRWVHQPLLWQLILLGSPARPGAWEDALVVGPVSVTRLRYASRDAGAGRVPGAAGWGTWDDHAGLPALSARLLPQMLGIQRPGIVGPLCWLLPYVAIVLGLHLVSRRRRSLVAWIGIPIVGMSLSVLMASQTLRLGNAVTTEIDLVEGFADLNRYHVSRFLCLSQPQQGNVELQLDADHALATALLTGEPRSYWKRSEVALRYVFHTGRRTLQAPVFANTYGLFRAEEFHSSSSPWWPLVSSPSSPVDPDGGFKVVNASPWDYERVWFRSTTSMVRYLGRWSVNQELSLDRELVLGRKQPHSDSTGSATSRKGRPQLESTELDSLDAARRQVVELLLNCSELRGPHLVALCESTVGGVRYSIPLDSRGGFTVAIVHLLPVQVPGELPAGPARGVLQGTVP